MPTTWYQAPITRIEDESHTVKRIWVDIPDINIFDYRAGQFITIDLPIGEKRLDRWRSYSIADAPNDSNQLELCIGYIPDGKASEYFFTQADIGTVLKFKGPLGVFCLPKTIEKDIVMICTGTGVAPFRSMIQELVLSPPSHNIHLIFGTKAKQNILYQDELEKIANTHPWFTYSIALSREEYKGYQGYVHNIYQERYSSPNEHTQFYLCGWSRMIDEATANLETMGYQKSHIIYELYG